MNGTVDEFGRALLTLTIRANQDAEPTSNQVWIDTAFNGELVMPRRIVESAQLEQTAAIEAARLADGNPVILESYSRVLDWFGEDRAIEVIANDGEFPLLGIGLLLGRRLMVDYAQANSPELFPHPLTKAIPLIREDSTPPSYCILFDGRLRCCRASPRNQVSDPDR